MAIYDHKYGDLSYFRVYRSWGGKEHQEYVRIKEGRKAAYAKAKEIDDRLAAEQKAYVIRQAQEPSYHIREDGSIRGLRRVTVTRKGRAPVDVFELRVNVPWEKQVKRTTISIAVHGDEPGFAMSISKICEWYGLGQDSEARAKMLDQLPHYVKESQSSGVADVAIQKAKDEIASFTGGLMKSLKRFTAPSEKA